MTQRQVPFQEDVIDRLGRIETSLESLKKLEPRVRAVEGKQWALGGGLGVVGAVLAWLGYHVTLPLH